MKILAVFAMFLLTSPALAALQTQAPAPDFSAQSSNGETVKLSDFSGKTVVLEWTNHGCPFVKKFYGAGEMQRLQKEATAKGIIWLRIISSAQGKQGYLSPQEAVAQASETGAHATHTLLDASGTIGRLYGAKTTPHMYVVNAEGVLVYQGAIDDNPSPNAADIEGASNYVEAALTALAEGKTPSPSDTKPYGCSVKYE